MRKDPADILQNHYRNILPHPRKPVNFDPWEYSLTNGPKGLGDCVIMSDLPFASPQPFGVHSHSGAWPAVEGLLKTGSGPYLNKWIRVDVAYSQHNLGPGHLFQRLRRLYGLDVPEKPFGKLKREYPQVSGRVAVHFDAGIHQTWQKEHLHPRAREIYPQNIAIIQEFVNQNPNFEFIEFGSRPTGLTGIKSCVGMELGLQLRVVGTCEWFLGIVSGFMHVAAAYECKSVVILNLPSARKIMLPTLVDTLETESEWLYPQNTHLHQDNAGPLVPRFSADSLRAAFNGEVYPYFKNDWLHMIDEKSPHTSSFIGFGLDRNNAKKQLLEN